MLYADVTQMMEITILREIFYLCLLTYVLLTYGKIVTNFGRYFIRKFFMIAKIPLIDQDYRRRRRRLSIAAAGKGGVPVKRGLYPAAVNIRIRYDQGQPLKDI